MQYLVNLANKTWLIDLFTCPCTLMLFYEHVSMLHLRVKICHFCACEKQPPTPSSLLFQPYTLFLDISDHATWRRPDEYKQRQSGRVKEQRCGTAAPGCQSASAIVTRLTDQKRERATEEKKKRLHYYLTRCNRFSFHFSLSILSLVHLFLVNSWALSSVSIKLRNTLTWFSFKMTISRKKVMWGSFGKAGEGHKNLWYYSPCHTSSIRGWNNVFKKGTRKVLFLHFIIVLCVSYWLTPSPLYLCEVKPVVGASLSLMLLFLTLVRK